MTTAQNPLIAAFRSETIIDRQIDEFIGIIKGVMADGMVTQSEVEFLLSWMDSNRKAANLWPAKALYPRLATALVGGKMSIEAESDILGLLMSTVGGNIAPQNGIHSDSTALPLTNPHPNILFSDQAFCFTGAFHSGSRRWCEDQISQRGGIAASGVTKKLNYLVIGDIGNENWLHSTHGRKIEKAVAYNDSGGRIAIVGEEHWFNHLRQ